MAAGNYCRTDINPYWPKKQYASQWADSVQSWCTVTQYWVHLALFSKSHGYLLNFRGSAESKNEHFLLNVRGIVFVTRSGNTYIIVSWDPVTPEEDHMLGRMTSMKRLWSSADRKPLATPFPWRGSWQGQKTQWLCSDRSVWLHDEGSPATPAVDVPHSSHPGQLCLAWFRCLCWHLGHVT